MPATTMQRHHLLLLPSPRLAHLSRVEGGDWLSELGGCLLAGLNHEKKRRKPEGVADRPAGDDGGASSVEVEAAGSVVGEARRGAVLRQRHGGGG